MKNAPHLVHNQQFVVPNYKWWEKPFYGIGLKIYDKMAGKLGLGPSQLLSRDETLALAPTLDPKDLKGGVLYHDGQFDDARLAISIAQTAVEQGAVLLNYFPVTALLKMQKKVCGVWVKDVFTGEEYEVRSKIVVNATGVFTDALMKMDDPKHENIIRASQGIHLVVEKEFLPGETAILIPRTDDGRVLFAVPWHGKIVLGTTAEPIPLTEEVQFILRHIGRYLTHDPQITDVKSMFAGLRPLVKRTTKRTAALSRDHLITIADSGIITVTGGKWTTYRKMAEDVVNIVSEKIGVTGRTCLTNELKLIGHDKPATPASISLLTKTELAALVRRSVKEEMCMTVEDFLSRRTRQLVLGAQAAIDYAPGVAFLMSGELKKDELWIKEQINNFNQVAGNYLPNKTISL
jgi:glycerol-3-phosphate dehydrogenase